MNSVGIQLVGGPADGRLIVIPGDPANPPRVYDGLIYEMGKRKMIYRRADGRGILGRRASDAETPWRYQYDGDRPVHPDEERDA